MGYIYDTDALHLYQADISANHINVNLYQYLYKTQSFVILEDDCYIYSLPLYIEYEPKIKTLEEIQQQLLHNNRYMINSQYGVYSASCIFSNFNDIKEIVDYRTLEFGKKKKKW